MDIEQLNALTVVVSIVGPFLAWYSADVRGKSRVGFIEEKFSTFKQATDRLTSQMQEKISHLEVKTAKSEQDRTELHKAIERIDAQKASREVVDGFREEIMNIKAEMDKRFDKLERLLESLRNTPNK